MTGSTDRGRRRRGYKAGLLCGALAALVPLPATPQEGGPRLTFGIAIRAETGANLALAVPSEGDTSELSTRLSFSLADETRTSRLSLDVTGALAARDTPDGSAQGFENPALRFAWGREGGRSSLDLTASLRESELDALRALVIDPDTGEISEDLVGEGTQSQVAADLAWSFGQGGPWGLTLSAGATETTYQGDTDEPDTTRQRAAASLRLALDPSTEATAGLRWSSYREDGEDRRDTLRADLGATRSLARGSLSLTFFAEETEDGTRSGLTLRRAVELPAGSLSYSLGITRDTGGNANLTGALDWAQDLARGKVTAGLRRSVGAGDDDAETVQTSLNLGLSQELGPQTGLSLGLTAAESEEVATGLVTRNAAFSATLTQALPRDWALDAGWRHRLREEDGAGRATSDSVFLELRRSFDWRP
jgi:hypothetical protein